MPVYFGDCDIANLTPRKTKKMLNIASETIKRQKHTIKYLHNKITRLRNKVKSLEQLICHLKDSNRISHSCYSVLQVSCKNYFKLALLKRVLSQMMFCFFKLHLFIYTLIFENLELICMCYIGVRSSVTTTATFEENEAKFE